MDQNAGRFQHSEQDNLEAEVKCKWSPPLFPITEDKKKNEKGFVFYSCKSHILHKKGHGNLAGIFLKRNIYREIVNSRGLGGTAVADNENE